MMQARFATLIPAQLIEFSHARIHNQHADGASSQQKWLPFYRRDAILGTRYRTARQVCTRSPQGHTDFDRKHEFILEAVFLEAVLRERRVDDDSSADRGFELWLRVLNEPANGSTATGPGRHR
jgi:hypothetical protein